MAIMYLYLFVGLGDFAVGWLSERLKSRKKTLFLFMGITIAFCVLFFLQRGGSATTFYAICMGLGFGAGFNVVYLTMGVEQFGTNLRARRDEAGISVITAISIVGVTVGVAALIIVLALMEGFEIDLRDKILGANAHLVVRNFSGPFGDYTPVVKKVAAATR